MKKLILFIFALNLSSLWAQTTGLQVVPLAVWQPTMVWTPLPQFTQVPQLTQVPQFTAAPQITIQIVQNLWSLTPTWTPTITSTPTNTPTIIVQVSNPQTPDQTKVAGKDIQLTQVFLQGLQATITSTFTSTVTPTPTNTPTIVIQVSNPATPDQTKLSGKDIQLTEVFLQSIHATDTRTPFPIHNADAFYPLPTATPQFQEVGVQWVVTPAVFGCAGGAATPQITPPGFNPSCIVIDPRSSLTTSTFQLRGWNGNAIKQNIGPVVTSNSTVTGYGFWSLWYPTPVGVTATFQNYDVLVICTVTGTPTVVPEVRFTR